MRLGVKPRDLETERVKAVRATQSKKRSGGLDRDCAAQVQIGVARPFPSPRHTTVGSRGAVS